MCVCLPVHLYVIACVHESSTVHVCVGVFADDCIIKGDCLSCLCDSVFVIELVKTCL